MIKLVDILSEGKLIKHKWTPIKDNKLKHAKCEHCKCERHFDDRWGKVVYTDRFGKLHPHNRPECVLPNTKMTEDLDYEHVTDAAPEKNKYQIGMKLNEQVSRIKLIIKELNEDKYTIEPPIDNNDDDDEPPLFEPQSPLAKKYSKIAVDKLSGDDEIEAYKWSTYTAIMSELEKLGEHKIIEEIYYWITDGKDPYKVFDDATQKCRQSAEIIRLRQVMQDFRDVESGHEPTIDDFLNPTDER
jgi:hypothetical protein